MSAKHWNGLFRRIFGFKRLELEFVKELRYYVSILDHSFQSFSDLHTDSDTQADATECINQ